VLFRSWAEGERLLGETVTRAGKAFTVSPGEGAFYGPKLEFHFKDAIGRSWQLGTVQVDMAMPASFGLAYVGEDGQEHRPIQGGGSEPFLIYGELRGLETAYMDLVLHPEIVHYCLDKLFDLAYESTRRLFETVPGKVLFSYVAEDLGSQEGLLISPAHVRTFLLPRMKRMMDLVHGAGAFVFHHSDGAVRPMIPEMIEAGIDLLNPIQWRCPGMEREALKRDFGAKIAFHGAMDNQRTLPFGAIRDVREEARDNLRILGAGGGYILAPCHNLQAVGPVENVVAMYETAYAEGWY